MRGLLIANNMALIAVTEKNYNLIYNYIPNGTQENKYGNKY